MPNTEEDHERQYTYELSLKTLQADLVKSKEIYKCQKNRLKQLTIKANQLQTHHQNDPKNPSLTFKKSKPK